MKNNEIISSTSTENKIKTGDITSNTKITTESNVSYVKGQVSMQEIQSTNMIFYFYLTVTRFFLFLFLLLDKERAIVYIPSTTFLYTSSSDCLQFTCSKPMLNSAYSISTFHRLGALKDRGLIFFSNLIASFTTRSVPVHGRMKKIFNRNRTGTIIFIAIVGLAVAIGIRITLAKTNKTPSPTAEVSGALTVPIEKTFTIQAYNRDKELADPIQFTISTAQITKQIIIKGTKANAVAGRTFLILNLKLVNQANESLFLNTRNYVRIQPKGTSDKLAPEIHNDTVEVQPASTKMTRIGLPVYENDKEFTLYLGEIEGEKEEVTIKF